MLYGKGMQGRIRKALTKFSFAHQKYWIIDGKSIHLSTGKLIKTITLGYYIISILFFRYKTITLGYYIISILFFR